MGVLLVILSLGMVGGSIIIIYSLMNLSYYAGKYAAFRQINKEKTINQSNKSEEES